MTEPETLPLVFIACGVVGLRKRWRQAIERRCAFHEVADRAAVERALVDRRPSAMLLDLQLPELGGMRGVEAIQRLRPATKILLLTKRPDEREGIAALKAGVRGYCDRDIDPLLLAKALEVV